MSSIPPDTERHHPAAFVGLARANTLTCWRARMLVLRMRGMVKR